MNDKLKRPHSLKIEENVLADEDTEMVSGGTRHLDENTFNQNCLDEARAQTDTITIKIE